MVAITDTGTPTVPRVIIITPMVLRLTTVVRHGTMDTAVIPAVAINP